MRWDAAPSPTCSSARASSRLRNEEGDALSVFLKAHWRSIMAADFFTAEVWSLHGLVTYRMLFVIELAKRIVHIAGITTRPNESWMMQVGRNLTDRISGCLLGESHLILDRDTKYTAQFRRLISESRTAVIRLPSRAPNLNAYAERFVRSIAASHRNQPAHPSRNIRLRRILSRLT